MIKLRKGKKVTDREENRMEDEEDDAEGDRH